MNNVLEMERTVRIEGSGEVRRYKRVRRARTIGGVRPAGKEPNSTVKSILRSTSAS